MDTQYKDSRSIEEWRCVEGFEDYYEVSNFGRIRSKERIARCGRNGNGIRVLGGNVIRPTINNNTGYLSVNLSANGKQYSKDLHRLIAKAFVPNPRCLRDVNHKNEIKTDNRAENLEWLSHQDNINYGSHNEKSVRNHNFKKVECIDDGRIFDTTGCAAKYYGLTVNQVSNNASGRSNSAKGLHFRYYKYGMELEVVKNKRAKTMKKCDQKKSIKV